MFTTLPLFIFRCQLQKDLDSRQQDLQAVRITLNEEKSHRIKAEKKCEMLESELQSQKETNSMLEGQVTEYKEMAKNLTDQVCKLQYCIILTIIIILMWSET